MGAVTGILATAWVGDRESVVQAVKSYWEDYVWKRDTQKLLDYYSHVIPGSIQDGDRDTASWLAYKYRHNKPKLWNNLETKYGIPVPDGEWPEDWENPNVVPTEPEEVDLDNDDNNEEKEEKDDKQEEEDTKEDEEPDL